MDSVQSFVLWFLEQIPTFLLSEPICYFVGFAFLIVVIKLFSLIIK